MDTVQVDPRRRSDPDHSKFQYIEKNKCYLDNCVCKKCIAHRLSTLILRGYVWLKDHRLEHLAGDPFTVHGVQNSLEQFYEGGWKSFIEYEYPIRATGWKRFSQYKKDVSRK